MTSCTTKEIKPRVFIFTDINIDAGDPDDRQSLIHLMWYADELTIEGIVPDRWYVAGYEACIKVLDEYARDFNQFNFAAKGYPEPEKIKNTIAVDLEDAVDRFHAAASDLSSPLYVLIWGNMVNFGEALRQKPEVASNIRVITIGTDLMREEHRPYLPDHWEKTEQPCTQFNWNGFGRNEIFNDERFKNMWWLEINWTYEGMFTGDEPTEMFEKLSVYGNLGQHMKDVVKNEPWARYFRVGDTPSVLYLIDPDNDFDDPTRGSWAGKFIKPFPGERPNYYTDYNGPIEWDYHNPCNTWENHDEMANHARGTLEKVRPAMYDELLAKLNRIYSIKYGTESKSKSSDNAAADWSSCEPFAWHREGGFMFYNNRWGGGEGCISVKRVGDAVTWWTTHDSDSPEQVTEAPLASIGSTWKGWADNRSLPRRLKDIEELRLNWIVSIPPYEPGRRFVIYLQFYMNDTGDDARPDGDIGLIFYREGFEFEKWGNFEGHHKVGNFVWSVVDKPEGGFGKYIMMAPEPNIQPVDNTLHIENFDIAPILRFLVERGYYSPDKYLVHLSTSMESIVIKGTIKTHLQEFKLVARGEESPIFTPPWIGEEKFRTSND